jgi:hypothetical protein
VSRNVSKFRDDTQDVPRVLIVLGLVLLVLQAPPEQPADLPQPASRTAGAVCNWDREYHSTLAALGEDEADWQVIPLPLGRGGQALMDQGRAEIDPDVACVDLSSLVKHEWVHLQQARMYGGQHAAVEFYGSYEQLEIAADCGARMLGATYTPYLADTDSCTVGLTRNAVVLISYQR